MPAPAKSTAEHQRDGRYRKERHANRLDNVAGVGLPKRPDWLNDGQAAVWSMVAECLPPKVLSMMDGPMMEALVTTCQQMHSRNEIDRKYLAPPLGNLDV